MRWTARRRLAAGAAGALALHALLALLVRVAPPRPAPPARKPPPPIAITLETKAPPPPQAPPVATKPHRGPARSGGTGGAKIGSNIRIPAYGGGGAADAAPGFSAVDEGIAPGVSTELRGDGFNFGSERGLPERAKTRGEELAEEKSTVERRIEGWTSATAAKLRAENPDSYWRNLGDALAKGFDPGWDVYDKGPHEGEGTVRSQFWDSWKREAANYGKSGNPFAADGEPEHHSLNEEFLSLRNEDRGLGSVSLGSTPTGVISFDVAVRGLAGKSFTHELVATVKITQRDDGTIFSVELFGSSGNLLYDKLALQQARKLDLMHLGPPKGGHATLWAFATTLTQVPPAPIAGCALDDFVPKNCWYPLQKRAHSRVTLLGIY